MDSAFVEIEDERNLMHIGATAIFEPGSACDGSGRIDEARYASYADAVLDRLPKWRQRLGRVPLFRHRVLVPDERFDLARHLHFVHLEHGTRRDLEQCAAEAYSLRLDRELPLWSQWVIDGLWQGRFAVVTKLHHAMADGIAGIGALAALLDVEPDTALPSSKAPVMSAPSPGELLWSELRWRAAEPGALLSRARRAARDPARLRDLAAQLATAAVSIARTSARPAPKTSFNPRQIGASRDYRCVRISLTDVKRVRRRTGATVNDVVLATVAGALKRFLRHRGMVCGSRDLVCMVPVSLHAADNADVLGNEVSLMLVPLPLGIEEPRERLQRIVDYSRLAKRTRQSAAFELGEHFAEWTFAPLVPWAIRLVARLRPFNIIVTNIPGPQFPLYLLDSKMVEVYPLVPLYQNQAIGIALLSYDGWLFWGLNADRELIPDLEVLAHAVESSFQELLAVESANQAGVCSAA